jgi:hypothetical protein
VDNRNNSVGLLPDTTTFFVLNKCLSRKRACHREHVGKSKRRRLNVKPIHSKLRSPSLPCPRPCGPHSRFGTREDCTVSVRCIEEKGLVLFVASGRERAKANALQLNLQRSYLKGN